MNFFQGGVEGGGNFERTMKPLARGSVAVLMASAILLAASWLKAEEGDQRGLGPLAIRSQQPLQLLFLGFDAEGAGVLPKGKLSLRLRVSQTNVLLMKAGDRSAATLDFEETRITLNAAYGLGRGVEVGIELPLSYASGGVLDTPIRGVERAFGLEAALRRKREEFPDFNCTFDVRQDDRLLFAQTSCHHLGLGDLTLKGKGQILEEGRYGKYTPAVAGRVGVKFPTGDQDRAFGSGEPDLGLGLILQKSLGRFTFYLNGDMIFPLKPGRFVRISSGPFFSGSASAEVHLVARFSLVVQLNAATRPFSDTDNKIFDHDLVEVAAGFNIGIGRNSSWQIGAAEDVFGSPGADADFTIFTNLTHRF